MKGKEHVVNNVFFGWIFGFGGAVTIAGPEDVAEEYRNMVAEALE